MLRPARDEARPAWPCSIAVETAACRSRALVRLSDERDFEARVEAADLVAARSDRPTLARARSTLAYRRRAAISSAPPLERARPMARLMLGLVPATDRLFRSPMKLNRRQALLAASVSAFASLLDGRLVRAAAGSGQIEFGPAQPFDFEWLKARGQDAGRSALPGTGDPPCRHPGDDRLRRVPADPLQAGAGAVGGRRRAVPGAVLPSRALLQAAGQPVRGRGRPGARDPLRHRLLHLRQDRAGPEAAGRSRLCRLSRDGRPRPENRLAGVSGRRLLPHFRRARPVRPVGARPRDRHRHALAGGVPAFHPVLARAHARRRQRTSSSTR